MIRLWIKKKKHTFSELAVLFLLALRILGDSNAISSTFWLCCSLRFCITLYLSSTYEKYQSKKWLEYVKKTYLLFFLFSLSRFHLFGEILCCFLLCCGNISSYSKKNQNMKKKIYILIFNKFWQSNLLFYNYLFFLFNMCYQTSINVLLTATKIDTNSTMLK